jgi:hypothetical protein
VGAFRSPRGTLSYRNLLPLVFTAAPALLMALYLMALPTGAPEPAWLPFGSLAVGGGWLAFWIAWSARSWAHVRRGALTVDRRGIALDDALVIRTEDIVSAEVVHAAWNKVFVNLRLRGKLRVRSLDVASDTEGRLVLGALGLDGAHARTTYRLPWRFFRWGAGVTFYMYLWFVAPFALVLGALASRGNHGELTTAGLAIVAGVFALATAAYWTLWARARLQITFGTDGMWLKQWGRERWLRWSDVRALDPWPSVRGPSEGFDLVLRDGERIKLATVRERMRRGMYEGDVVADRIRETMTTATKPAGDVRVALPASEGRGAREWIEDLRRAGSGTKASFRVAPVDPDDLWCMLEDPNGAPADRAAAATALAVARDEPTRVRLRAAAAAVASPKLRVAIEAAAGDDDDRLAEALEALETVDGDHRDIAARHHG